MAKLNDMFDAMFAQEQGERAKRANALGNDSSEEANPPTQFVRFVSLVFH